MTLYNPVDFQAQDSSDSIGTIDVRRYLFLLWQWAWLILLAAVLAGGAAFFISRRITPVYETKTKLLIIEASADQSADYQDVLASERRTRTYSDMMMNDSILQEVIDRLTLETTIKEFRDDIEVAPVRDTQLVQLSVEGTDPDLIADITNTIVSVFIDRISGIQTQRYETSIESLAAQLQDIEGILEQIQSQIEDIDRIAATQTPPADDEVVLPYNNERENLEAQELQYHQIYADLLTSYEQARLAESQSHTNIIQINEAKPPIEPIKPDLLLNTILAGISGAALSAGIIIIVSLFEDTIKTPDQVEKILGLPVIGVIFEHQNNDSVISQDLPRSFISEAFRTLRTNIQYIDVDKKICSILITSPTQGAGKSLISSNLAVVNAQVGKKTMLLDADLRRPSIHKFFKLKNEKGITSLFMDEKMPISKAVQKTEIEGLSIVTSGDLPPNPAEFLDSQRMDDVFSKLAEKQDIVIFDAPPILPVTDAVVLAAKLDGVLLVLMPGKTSIAAARQTVKNLRRINAHILGVVLNNVKMKRTGYSNYYRKHYGYYQSEYFDETEGTP